MTPAPGFTPAPGLRRRPSSRQRGAILVIASWALIILAGLAILMAQEMRVEAIASGNQLAQLQADAAERGGEQWVLAQVDNSQGDAVTVTTAPAEALPIGDNYFWVLQANLDNPQQYTFGITDEAGKMNLNTAGLTRLQNLPVANMTSDVAYSIIAWRGGSAGAAQGIDDDNYYMSLPAPDNYHCKAAPFESVEELLLVRGVDAQMLFGYDTNRNGVLDDAEVNAGGMATQINTAQNGGMGMFPYFTVSSIEPNTDVSGAARINVNTLSSGSRLSTYLQKNLPSKAAGVMLRFEARLGGRRPAPYANLIDFCQDAKLTSADFAAIADGLTTSSSTNLTGLVNVNTASQNVLACLPNMTDADAQTLVAQRAANTTAGSYAWVLDALQPAMALAIGNFITGRSYVFSADIIGVSGDGRAYKRVRIVVDARTSPPKITYRKDLTDLGWPLDPAIRTALRAGQSPTGALPVLKGGH
jgi:type II secretory pathway component PulK